MGAQAQEVGSTSQASRESRGIWQLPLSAPGSWGGGVGIPSPMSQAKAVTQEKIQGEGTLGERRGERETVSPALI